MNFSNIKSNLKTVGFAVYIFVTCVAVYANQSCLDVLSFKLSPEQIFTENYTTCFVDGKCQLNISDFIKKLIDERVELSDSEVLILPQVNFYGVRSGPETFFGPNDQGSNLLWVRWDYHVIFKLNGKIYDFNHSNSPSPKLLVDYLMSAWKPSWAVQSDDNIHMDGVIYSIDPLYFIENTEDIIDYILSEVKKDAVLDTEVKRTSLRELLGV